MSNVSDRQSASRHLRHRVGPWIDRFARVLGQPTTRVSPAGYVATVDCPIGDLEAELRGEFTWDPVSLYHYRTDGTSSDGSWMYRSGWFADRQLHVVLFARSAERTDVYAHDEYSWLRHPIRHAYEVDVRHGEAVASMRRWLERRELDYDRHSTARRALEDTVVRLRERSSRLGALTGPRSLRFRSSQ